MLLGYPAVLLVEAPGARRASARLGAAALRLFSLRAACRALPSSPPAVLSSFSVPEALCDAELGRSVDGWLAAAQAAAALDGVFHNLVLHTGPAPSHAVAL